MQYQPTLGQINYAPSEVAQQRVDPEQAMSGDQGASKLLGQLNRAQWNDWRNRFSPYVDELASVAQDSSAPSTAAANASSAVGLRMTAVSKGLSSSAKATALTKRLSSRPPSSGAPMSSAALQW